LRWGCDREGAHCHAAIACTLSDSGATIDPPNSALLWLPRGRGEGYYGIGCYGPLAFT